MSARQWQNLMIKAQKGLSLHDFKSARISFEKALRVAEQKNDVDMRFESLTLLALTCRQLHDWNVAEDCAKRLVDIAINCFGFGSREHGLTMHGFAEMYYDKGDFDLAEKTASMAEEILAVAKLTPNCDDCKKMRTRPVILLAELAHKRGDMGAAKSWLTLFWRLHDVQTEPVTEDEEVHMFMERARQNRLAFKQTWFHQLPTDSVRKPPISSAC